jgi:hypothetical protein
LVLTATLQLKRVVRSEEGFRDGAGEPGTAPVSHRTVWDKFGQRRSVLDRVG